MDEEDVKSTLMNNHTPPLNQSTQAKTKETPGFSCCVSTLVGWLEVGGCMEVRLLTVLTDDGSSSGADGRRTIARRHKECTRLVI